MIFIKVMLTRLMLVSDFLFVRAMRKPCSSRSVFVLLALMLVAPQVSAMDVLSDTAMAEMTGQSGMGLTLTMAFNADKTTGLALTAPTVALNSGDFSNCASATVFSSTACRVAVQFAGRTDEWLVLKNFSGLINIPKMNLDISTTPGAATAFANTGRITAVQANSKPILSLSFKAPVEIQLTIGAVAFENGATGYTGDTAYASAGWGALATTYATQSLSSSTSLMGVKIGNTAVGVPQAKMDIQGTIGVFGF